LEKFEIERVYWQNRQIDWGIVTDQDICPVTVENVKILYDSRDVKNLANEITSDIIRTVHSIILQHHTNKSIVLIDLIKHCASELDIPRNLILTAFYFLLANHFLEIDISKPLNLRKEIYIFKSQNGGESS
jgi:hypothetical protein